MDTTTLGRTGLTVSVMGLGGGGPSALGLRAGDGEAAAERVVRRALELGVTFIDTAECYGTEGVIGRALRDVPRDSVVLATKLSTWVNDGQVTAKDLVRSLDASLKRLATDHVDLYQLHGVSPERYEPQAAELVPAMQRERDKGKLRFIGITEGFEGDTRHRMLARALKDEVWDVVMVGFNLLNPSARRTVFPATRRKNVGTLVMFAVRKALSRPERLRELVGELLDEGRLDPAAVDRGDPLGFLLEAGAASLPDAAYRFCRHEPGVGVTLSGTGNPEHLEANAASLSTGPLPREALDELERLFGRVDSVSGS